MGVNFVVFRWLFRWLSIPLFMLAAIAVVYFIDSSLNEVNEVSPSLAYEPVAYGETKQLRLEDIGHDNSKAMLIIKQHPRSISVLPGSKVIFESAFVANGDATYLWKRDDDSKLDVGRTSGINSKRLTISNVMPSDAGSYVCVTSQKSTDIVSDKVILHVKKVACPTNIVISNGNAQISEDGRSVTYQCADNFKLVGAAAAECKQDGTWTSPPPKCIVPCPTSLAIPDGIVKFSEDGRSVTYQCVDKFKLVGSALAECKEDGTWSSPPPKCTGCPTDMAIPNGNVKISEDGRSVTYQCADKFKLFGAASAECKQDETWSSPPPTCIVPCPTNLVIPDGIVKISEDGRSVIYQCADTFKLVGPASAECKQDGTWSSPPPKCITISCPTELVIPNGNVKINEDSKSVSYQCADKFKLVGSASAECKQDGTWSSPPPTCIESKSCLTGHNANEAELAEMSERVAKDPFELRYVAKHCEDRFHQYVNKMSTSTIDRLCQKLGISSLTSTQLQRDFMQCPGLTLYQFFLDSEGNVQVPKPFSNCKKMSFRDSGVPTMLVSFPGSGNSWVRQLLESTTGIYTGSVFCDLDYIKNGMIGEGIHSQNVLAIKFHYGKPPPLPFKKIMFIIRNPYDAILAEYKRWYQSDRISFKRTELVKNPHTSDLPDQNFGGREWIHYVKMLSGAWSQHVKLWLGPNTPHNAAVLVIKYENLKSDLRTELKRMMDFLEYPYTEEDLDCTISSNTNAFHRHHDSSKEKEHFSKQQVDLIYNGIRQVDSILRKYNVSYTRNMS